MVHLQEIDWMGDDERPPLDEPDSNDEMPSGPGDVALAASTPKASPMVPPGEVSTPATERRGVANFVAKPKRKAKASGKKRAKKTAKK